MVQSFVVVRSSYTKRVFERIWADSHPSAKGRAVTLVVSLVGLALGYLYATELHQVTNWQALKIAIEAGISANILWLLGVLLYNTVRVPWLLDAESNQIIVQMEQRAQTAERSLQDRTDKKSLSKRFVELLQEGAALSYKCSEGALNDLEIERWVTFSIGALVDAGCETDSVSFLHADGKAAPVMGIVNEGHRRETQRRRLECYRDKLQEIVERKQL